MNKQNLLTFWSYVKRYWGVAAALAGMLFAVLLFNKKTRSFAEERVEIDRLHREELDRIQELRLQEQAKNAENDRILKEQLASIQLQYEDAKQDLDEKKQKQIVDLIKKHGKNPIELARQLSLLTGFQVILPTE
jgi:hypothetical protein